METEAVMLPYGVAHVSRNCTPTEAVEPMEVDKPKSLALCCHVIELKNEYSLRSYKLLHVFYVSCVKKGSFKRKCRDCICNVRSCQTYRKRVHACLLCVYFGCFNGHIQFHAAEQNHPLAVDIDSGQLYCALCADYKYDPDFEKIARELNIIASSQRHLDMGKFFKWVPSEEEIDLLKFHEVLNNSETDVRGLVNISNFTCYLSSIVQCLIHAPVFRDYLLSLKHQCNSEEDSLPNCFICEMTNVLQECFSGKKEPFALSRLLYLLYKRVNIFAEKQMWDAHECFMHLLENFHKDETNEDKTGTKDYSVTCECIIHSVFEFQFRRQRRCNSNLKTHVTDVEDEKRWEVSLYTLPENNNLTEVPFSDCLRRSLLEQRDDYYCPECKEKKGCIIQSIPKKLPYVMNFCINNYESILKKKRTKNKDENSDNRGMIYEQTLDMSSYMLLPKSSLEYYLFAIVEHIDGGNDGHYTCYVRKYPEQWFLCNDTEIIPINKKTITEIKARILFYHRIIA